MVYYLSRSSNQECSHPSLSEGIPSLRSVDLPNPVEQETLMVELKNTCWMKTPAYQDGSAHGVGDVVRQQLQAF